MPKGWSKKCLNDLTGKVFSRLTVLEMTKKFKDVGYSRAWVCRCICGNEITVHTSQLTRGSTKSCGCYIRDTTVARNKATGIRGGLTAVYPAEHRSWCKMIDRCTKVDSLDWKDYGGRGIKICENWLEFSSFIEDMGRRPSATHSIDRIDVNGDYNKENCRWATPVEQARNKRNTLYMEKDGVKIPLIEVAALAGIGYYTAKWRFHQGWSYDEIISTRYSIYEKDKSK